MQTSTNSQDRQCPFSSCDGGGYIWVDNSTVRECICLVKQREKAMIERLFEVAKVPKMYQRTTLENFDPTRQPEAYRIAEAYVREWERVKEEGEWLLLVGDYGTGKTHLAFGILNALLNQGVSGLAATVPDMLDELRPGRDDENERMRALKTIDLLILDDLGAERDTEWVRERLFAIFNARSANLLPTVITSNVSLEELERQPHPWPATVNRIIGHSVIVYMQGESYRLKQARERRRPA